MPRVAILYDHVLDWGGLETHLLSLFRCSHDSPYEYVAISQASAEFTRKAAEYGITVIPWQQWGFVSPASCLALARLLRQQKIALVHIHGPIAGINGRLAGRLAGIPVVVTVHLPVSLYHGTRQTLRARLGRSLYTFLDRLLNHFLTQSLIYVSHRTMEASLQKGISPPLRSIYIPNGVRIETIDPPFDRHDFRQQWHAAAEDIVFLFAGRLDEQKGIDSLLEAVARLDITVKWKVWLVGDGPLSPFLKEMVRQQGLDARITFCGAFPQVHSFLVACDVFVLPSRYEAMPMALLEAMAAALPCIVTDVGENSLLVSDGINGKVVPAGSIEALQEAMNFFLHSSSWRPAMGQASFQRVQPFSETIMTRKVYDIYSQVLARQPAR